VPLEAQRVEVDEAAVATFYNELEAMIDGIPAEIIYNADETGCSDWMDAHEIRVLVPDVPDHRLRSWLIGTARERLCSGILPLMAR
jgi:hypothetical protein